MTERPFIVGAHAGPRAFEAVPDVVRLADIAHALSLMQRFSGHTRRPYSVAEHSLIVVDIMEHVLGIYSPSALLAGLMHDAYKAYAGEVPLPMKHLFGVAWTTEEDRLQWCMLRRFGVAPTFVAHLELIRHAYGVAQATVRRDLMREGAPDELAVPDCQPLPNVRLSERSHLQWTDWRQAFTDRFNELERARRHRALQ